LFCTGRNYDDENDVYRKEIFTTNLKRIEMHNYLHSKGLKSYRLGITPFADMVSLTETHFVISAPKSTYLASSRTLNHARSLTCRMVASHLRRSFVCVTITPFLSADDI